MNIAPVYGLVLSGGASRRMQSDKAALVHQGETQLQRAFDLLARHCVKTFISVRSDQQQDELRSRWPQIVDAHEDIGPLAGIAAAQATQPQAAWLIIACDLLRLSDQAVQSLLQHRDPNRFATAYRSTDGEPEPLCAIWEPAAATAVREAIATGNLSPRRVLQTGKALLIDAEQPQVLSNVNTPDDYQQAQRPMLILQLQYFAIFREQAGKRSESIQTQANTPALLYTELQQRHGFKLAAPQLKVAVNNAFCDWNATLKSGDHVAFIPPVAGG